MNGFYTPLFLLSVIDYSASGTCKVLDRIGEYFSGHRFYAANRLFPCLGIPVCGIQNMLSHLKVYTFRPYLFAKTEPEQVA